MGFRVDRAGPRVHTPVARSRALAQPGIAFCVSAFGFRVSGFWVSGFGFFMSVEGIMVWCLVFSVQSVGLRVQGVGCAEG